MKLRLKLFTLLTVSYLLIFVVLQFASNSFLLGGIEELEIDKITKDMSIGVSTLNHKVLEIDEAATRLASYNDVYQYILSGEPAYVDNIQNIFTDAAFKETGINYVFLFDDQGEAVFEKGYSLVVDAEMPVSEEMTSFFVMNSILVVHSTPSSKLKGVLKTPEGLVLISSQAVRASKDLIVGSIVLCRLVDTHLVEALQHESLLFLDLIPVLDSGDAADYEEIISTITLDSPFYVSRLNMETMRGFTVINDLYGNPGVLIKVDSPRLIYQQGVQMVDYFVVSFVLIGISICMLVILAVNRMVIMPVSKLSNEVADINPSTINNTSVEMSGNDEISSLSKDIDKMLEALRNYQKKLKDIERVVAIGATATMVGHDLRNPLQVVFMLIDLVQKKLGRLGEHVSESELGDIERLTARIKEQAKYMNKVISDLQGLTKGISIEIEDVNIESLTWEVLENIQIPWNIEANIFFEDEFPEIFADKTKLRRVFTNLMINAVQAMDDGGELVVKGHREGENVCVSVLDTGSGISEDYIDRIFDPLFTTKAKGSGLGLTVCKRITEAHGGEILLRSHLGVGSCFTVVLPITNKSMVLNHEYEEALEYILPEGYILPTNL